MTINPYPLISQLYTSGFPADNPGDIRTQKIWGTSLKTWENITAFCLLLGSIPNPQALFLHSPPRLKKWESNARLLFQINPTLINKILAVIQRCPQLQERFKTLETEFSEEVIRAIDVNQPHDFKHFLEPNEEGVSRIIPHLAIQKPGLYVVTGTERCFFDLGFADPKCEGLVGRDFDPQVKAYMDFNILLLRTSTDIDEYFNLSMGDLNDNKETLQDKIKSDKDLSLEMKEYYLRNLVQFGKIYYDANAFNLEHFCNPWKSDSNFEDVHYHKKQELFDKIHRYAKCGNIISTLGLINDLRFLDRKNIAVLDTSNISDYSMLDPMTRSNPTIITTRLHVARQYRSIKHQPISEEQRAQINQIIEILRGIWLEERGSSLRDDILPLSHRSLPEDVFPCYSEALLHFLAHYKNQYLMQKEGKWVRKPSPYDR